MLLNPCPVCQDRQTWSCWVWLLNPWKIAPNPCLYILSHQGRNIFPVRVFPSLNRSAIILQAPERLRCLLYSLWAESHVLLKWLLSASEGCLSTYRGISSSSTWTSPWEGKQGDGWGEGKGRRRGSREQNWPVAQRPLGIWSGLWLSTHPSWPEAGKRLVSFSGTLKSKQHKACNSITTN